MVLEVWKCRLYSIYLLPQPKNQSSSKFYGNRINIPVDFRGTPGTTSAVGGFFHIVLAMSEGACMGVTLDSAGIPRRVAVRLDLVTELPS